MAKSVSPFAKLTCQEKNLKWLEYQNNRLPYVQTNVDVQPLEEPVNESAPKPSERPVQRPATPTPDLHNDPSPPPPQSSRMWYPPEYWKPRHRQYDAVIGRIKQAEERALRYTSVQ